MRSDEKGVALMVVLMTGLMIVLIASYALNFGYNQKKQIRSLAGTTRPRVYYLAQAGVMDAMWRIRKNISPPGVAVVTSGATSFNTTSYDPAPYYININGTVATGTTDTAMYSGTQESWSYIKVDIGPVDSVTKQRKIVSTGLG